ncbi:MAG: alpha-ketoglutarate-dependent dioxygenase AlkB [Bacteroidota bacterium]|nr:alpha-ketoglutarate-dependent dioxygenase AlkB [Bacteroidota bacterium]
MWTQTKNILPRGGEVYLYNSFFTAPESEEVFDELLKNVEWRQDSMTIRGKTVNLPRLTAWYGNEGKCYRSPGIFKEPLPWTDMLLDIKQFVEDRLDIEFNSALLNLYRNESDDAGWHRDNESGLGFNPVIASLSFGNNREFQLKHKDFPKEKITGTLQNGSLLLMRGETQVNWRYRISPSKEYHHPGINLTFRKII